MCPADWVVGRATDLINGAKADGKKWEALELGESVKEIKKEVHSDSISTQERKMF